MTEAIQSAGKIDIEKDLLSQLGPKLVVYLAPNRSAVATGEESMDTIFRQGLNPASAVTAIQSLFPKLTIVAEVKNSERFGKALDAAVIAINNELKVQAIEIATREDAERGPGPGGEAGAGMPPGGRGGAGARGAATASARGGGGSRRRLIPGLHPRRARKTRSC